MILFPNAKINLGLHILHQRPDGYHRIETCFYPIPWSDVLEIIPGSEWSISISGIEVSGNKEDNLCIKAWHLLHQGHGIPPVQMHLHKIVPVGAGLGGGSSDAAFTLVYLNQLFELNLTEHQLIQYAAQLGSDCAFFVKNSPVFATERGDVWQPISVNLEGYFLAVIYPDIHVSTALAYKGAFKRGTSANLYTQLQKPISEWKHVIENDFEKSVFATHPQIETLKNDLYHQGAVYAAMSGSGSAVYGLFESEPTDIRHTYAGYKAWFGVLPRL